ALGPGFWREALAAGPRPAQVGAGPYGPLLAPDANGLRLPSGFSSRRIARGSESIAGYGFPWQPDGQATYATPDGGWILVTNSEAGDGDGGVSATRFARDGRITAGYRILGGTSTNCAGGATPWGTWLSCEEIDDGRVWECDPTGARPAVAHAAMGVFKHEAACVDPGAQVVYLTEDVGGGGLYRYTPRDYPDLSAGLLEVACDGGRRAGTGAVVWREVPDPGGGARNPTRRQVRGMLPFARGEGIWFDAGIVYVATTEDETIHAYDTRAQTLSTLYRAADAPGTPLRGVDSVVVSRSGDLFVAEDSYDADPDAMDVCLITPQGRISRFLKLTGEQHFLRGQQSEVVGLCFDPSGTRMYLGSQRAWGVGAVYEVSGPFRQERPAGVGAGAPAGGGAPLGLDVARRVSVDGLLRRGLALGLTLDRPATVRVRLTARLGGGAGRGRPRTVTLARAERRAGRGPERLRLRPASRAVARMLRARRAPLEATLEVRVSSPGSPTRVLRRSVRIAPGR
ncbi:MAG TPA: alkaline phosphatase PhoX, partial [Conexibacter sp.]|nr:alkaline phosphatase PhoX [Conexibacter sp.]